MNQNKLQKLELTWIGKDEEREAIEPRILIEDPKYSYGDTESGNMLIHGDNLLALKALDHTIQEMPLNIMMMVLSIQYGFLL